MAGGGGHSETLAQQVAIGDGESIRGIRRLRKLRERQFHVKQLRHRRFLRTAVASHAVLDLSRCVFCYLQPVTSSGYEGRCLRLAQRHRRPDILFDEGALHSNDMRALRPDSRAETF